jgi:hypothetical protein
VKKSQKVALSFLRDNSELQRAEYQEEYTKSMSYHPLGLGFEKIDSLTKKYYDFIHENKFTSKQIFELKFGKALVRKKYSKFNHIWSFSCEKAQLNCLVSSDGIAWELDAGKTTSKKALEGLMEQVINTLIS